MLKDQTFFNQRPRSQASEKAEPSPSSQRFSDEKVDHQKRFYQTLGFKVAKLHCSRTWIRRYLKLVTKLHTKQNQHYFPATNAAVFFLATRYATTPSGRHFVTGRVHFSDGWNVTDRIHPNLMAIYGSLG